MKGKKATVGHFPALASALNSSTDPSYMEFRELFHFRPWLVCVFECETTIFTGAE